MKNKVLLIILILFICINVDVNAEILPSSLVGSDTGNYYEKTSLNSKLLVRYGSIIEFTEDYHEQLSITSSNPSIAGVANNKVEIIGSGSFSLTITQGTSVRTLDFFAWNSRLRKDNWHFGNEKVYSDAECTNNLGYIKGEAYYALDKAGNNFKIRELMLDHRNNAYEGSYATGDYDTAQRPIDQSTVKISESNGTYIGTGNPVGNYIKSYYDESKHTSSSHYALYYMWPSQTTYTVSLKDFTMTTKVKSDELRTEALVKSSGSTTTSPSTFTSQYDPQITSTTRSNNYGFFHAISYGASIVFVDGAGEARIASENVIKGEANTLKVVGTGRCDVIVKANNVETPYSFFSWNYKLKGGKIDVYSDASLSQKVGSMNGECYLVCNTEGNALKISEYLYSSGFGDVEIKGKYISKSQSSTYLEDVSSGSQRKVYISLKSFSIVRPVTKTVTGSASTGGSTSTGGFTSTVSSSFASTGSNAKDFLEICKQTIMYLKKYNYGYKSGGLGIPPYPKGGSMSDNPSSSTHNVDCVDYVRWSLYEYGKIKGITAFTEKPVITSYIPSFHSEAKKQLENKESTAWIKYFDVVYLASNHNTGLGRESDITVDKIKSLLKPGDILVYTGGPRFEARNSTTGVTPMNSNHIDVFAGFSGNDTSSSIGVLIYSCGSAPSAHSEYTNGSPVSLKYALKHTSDAHGFWDVTVVLRLKETSKQVASGITSNTNTTSSFNVVSNNESYEIKTVNAVNGTAVQVGNGFNIGVKEADYTIQGSDPAKSRYYQEKALPDGTPFNYQVYIPEKVSNSMPVIVVMGGGTGTSNLPKTLYNRGVKENKGLDAIVVTTQDAVTTTLKPCSNMMKLLKIMSFGNFSPESGAPSFGINSSKMALMGYSKGVSSIILTKANTGAEHGTLSYYTVEDVPCFKYVSMASGVGVNCPKTKIEALQKVSYVDVLCGKDDKQQGYENYKYNYSMYDDIKNGSTGIVTMNRSDNSSWRFSSIGHGSMGDHVEWNSYLEFIVNKLNDNTCNSNWS